MDLDSSSVGSTTMAHNPQSLTQGPVKGPYTTLSTAATSADTTTGTTATTNTSPRTTIPIMASTEVPTTTGAAAGPRDLHSSQPANFDPQNAGFDPLSDWPPRILLEMKDMLLLLASDGRIVQDISRFIHTEDRAFFAAEMDDCILNSRPFHCHFRFYKRDNASCVLEAYGHPHMANSESKSGNSNENKAQTCVILVCRLYPTKSSQTLDSFLEHKLENIRLRERIAQLRAEEKEEDIKAGQQPATGNQTTTTTTTHTMQSTFITSVRSSFTQSNAVDANGSGDDSDDLSDESDSHSILEQGEDRVPQTDDMSHIAGIELITGLNYGAGERSQGLSTGQRHGRLINCNKESSSPNSQEQDSQDSDRRKRLKGEYMCTDCGTADSPEWRKGPEGPKTLCNACGLRWAKKEKKRQDPI